jgi:hypothetical protein
MLQSGDFFSFFSLTLLLNIRGAGFDIGGRADAKKSGINNYLGRIVFLLGKDFGIVWPGEMKY